ncbi:TIGR02301 family protein [Ensifer soli]|uniref:TIGR02301 family protein n=1 Tax=Ciceribacter sp. sgz301302 TaxID=3342379 RepID=UPI0035B723E5
MMRRLSLACALALLAASPAVSQSAPAQTDAAPYDGKLLRLAEILGSVDYLRHLCGATDAAEWRTAMQDLIERETAGEEKRRERLTAAFNRGYRSFASVYTRCTPAAVSAEQNYRAEGATLVAEIVARYGN